MTTGPEDGTVPFADEPTPFEDDPTGMRALLSSLADPGPMPGDLVTRIQASLAAEAAARASTADPAAAPVLPMPPRAGRRLGAHIPRRRLGGPPRWLLPVAAAAVVLAGGGAVVTGLLKGGNNSLSAGAGDVAARESPASAAAGGNEQAPQRMATPSTASSASAARTPVTTIPSGRGFRAEELLADATRLLRLVLAASATDRAEEGSPAAASFGLGGPLACAERLGASTSSRVIVESGTFAGAPASLVAYSVAPGTWTANIVGSRCGREMTDRLVGPVSVSEGTKSS